MTRAVWVSGATAVPLRKTGDVLLPGVGALATLESLGFMAGCVMRLGVAKHGPINVGAYFLAEDSSVGQNLNFGGVFRRYSSTGNPLLNRLVAFDPLNKSGRVDGATKKANRPINGVLFAHRQDSIQEKLATQGEHQENLAMTGGSNAPKFAAMNESIHARIKRLRLQKGLSMEALASLRGASFTGQATTTAASTISAC